MTKLGDYAPEKDTEAAIETRRALLMLIGGKNRSGLVSRTELLEKADSRWTEDEIKRNKSTNNLNVDEIQKWLTGTRVPTNNKVWTLGECLHDAGYQWASGLLLLWNCGRLTAYLEITRHLFQRGYRYTRERVRQYWHMTALASDLAISTDLDNVEPFATFFRNKASFDQEARSALLKWRDSHETLTAAVVRTIEGFAERELAKEPWNLDDQFRQDIASARDRAFNNETPPSLNEFDHFISVICQAVAAESLALNDRRLIALSMISSWFDMLHSGLRRMIVEFPIDHRYNVSSHDLTPKLATWGGELSPASIFGDLIRSPEELAEYAGELGDSSDDDEPPSKEPALRTKKHS